MITMPAISFQWRFSSWLVDDWLPSRFVLTYLFLEQTQRKSEYKLSTILSFKDPKPTGPTLITTLNFNYSLQIQSHEGLGPQHMNPGGGTIQSTTPSPLGWIPTLPRAEGAWISNRTVSVPLAKSRVKPGAQQLSSQLSCCPHWIWPHGLTTYSSCPPYFHTKREGKRDSYSPHLP